MKLPKCTGIAAAAIWLPETRESAEEAVAAGRLTGKSAADLGCRSVAAAWVPPDGRVTPPDAVGGADPGYFAGGPAAPEMAVRALDSALRRSGIRAGQLDLLCHAWMHYQGHDLWSPAHYVANAVGACGAVPVGVQQICNGGAAAVELAVARLAHSTGRRTAVVTTADRFTPPGFDRWGGDFGVVYGDGATALVIQMPAGDGCPLHLLSVSTVAAPQFEAMHRGQDPFSAWPQRGFQVIDMRRTKRTYLKHNGIDAFAEANADAIRRVLNKALCDIGLTGDDKRIRYVVLPRFGARNLRESWIPVVSELLTAELLDWGPETGHLGAGDASAGIADLLKHELLRPGEIALVLSAGAGFTWSCLAVQAV